MEPILNTIKDAVQHLLQDAGYDAEVYDNLDVIFNESTPQKTVVWFAHGDLRFLAQTEYGYRVDMTIMRHISDHTAIQDDASDDDIDEMKDLKDKAYELREELDSIEKQIEERVGQLTIADKNEPVEELDVPGSKTWSESEDPIVKDVLSE